LAIFELRSSIWFLRITHAGHESDELAAVIKQRSPRLPIILLTGCWSNSKDARILCDIDLVVEKPFAIESVRERWSMHAATNFV